jgi:hypothetical protein
MEIIIQECENIFENSTQRPKKSGLHEKIIIIIIRAQGVWER